MDRDVGDDTTAAQRPDTVAETVVDRLVAGGIDTVFGIPGKQTLPLNQALDERDVRFVITRHETAVPHAAWGYAESSDPGTMAATIVVPGPGDMNTMNGLKNARNDAVPMVHLAVETEREIRGGDGIHETPPDTYDNVCKANVLVESPGGAAAAVDEAIRVARQHPQGPVRVGIPKDVLASRTPQTVPGERPPTEPPSPPKAVVDEAAATLADATEPVLLVGGGVRRADATDAMRTVADRLDAPIVTTYKGKGSIPETHPRSAGVLCGGSSTALRELLASSDACLAVGTDLDAVATAAWSVELPDTLIHATLGADDIAFGYETTLGVVADADRFLRALEDSLAARGVEATDNSSAPTVDNASTHDSGSSPDGVVRAQAVREADADRFAALATSGAGAPDDPLRSVEVLQAVRDAVPDKAIVTADAGGSRVWTLVSFPAAGPQSYVNPGSWATMGTGVPSAAGAAIANPDRPAVAITGDGGLMMCIHELHTLATADLDVTVVAMNNDDYAIISEEATRSYGFEQQAYGWPETSLDLTTIANGMGVRAERVRRRDAVAPAVADAIEHDGPALVEVFTDPDEPQASEWMTQKRE